jgi:hypothetical protein
MSLTTPALVQAVLGDDYGPKQDGTLPDLQPYCDAADVIIQRVVICAQKRKHVTLSSGEQEMIERWLAAHLYAVSDKPYQSRSTEGASGAFAGQTEMGFDATLYGQQAQRLDWSGCLRNLDKQQRAGGKALGRRRGPDERWGDW